MLSGSAFASFLPRIDGSGALVVGSAGWKFCGEAEGRRRCMMTTEMEEMRSRRSVIKTYTNGS